MNYTQPTSSDGVSMLARSASLRDCYAILTAALFHVSFTPMDYLGFVLIIGTLLVTQIP